MVVMSQITSSSVRVSPRLNRAAETAVEAVVGTVVGDIERGEEDQSVAVDGLLDLPGRRPDHVNEFFVFRLEEKRGLLRRNALEFSGLGDDFLHTGPLGTGRPVQNLLDFKVVNKILHFLFSIFADPGQERFHLGRFERLQLSRHAPISSAEA